MSQGTYSFPTTQRSKFIQHMRYKPPSNASWGPQDMTHSGYICQNSHYELWSIQCDWMWSYIRSDHIVQILMPGLLGPKTRCLNLSMTLRNEYVHSTSLEQHSTPNSCLHVQLAFRVPIFRVTCPFYQNKPSILVFSILKKNSFLAILAIPCLWKGVSLKNTVFGGGGLHSPFPMGALKVAVSGLSEGRGSEGRYESAVFKSPSLDLTNSPAHSSLGKSSHSVALFPFWQRKVLAGKTEDNMSPAGSQTEFIMQQFSSWPPDWSFSFHLWPLQILTLVRHKHFIVALLL